MGGHWSGIGVRLCRSSAHVLRLPPVLPDQRIEPSLQFIRGAVIPDAAQQGMKTLVSPRLALDPVDRLHADDVFQRSGGEHRQQRGIGLDLENAGNGGHLAIANLI